MNRFKELGLMVDCSRNSVMTVNTVKRLIDLISSLGYNSLQLYTEDTFTVENEKYFGYLRGRYSFEELRQIDEYATGKGITLIPCVQTLAHLSKIFRWKPYWNINDCNDILLVQSDRTYELIDNIFSSLSKCFTSRIVNIGMDEAHMLGLGKFKDLHGDCDRSEIMRKHLGKVLGIARKYGFKCRMWSDMFFRLAGGGDYYNSDEKISVKAPDDLELIYWDYYSVDSDRYSKMIGAHKRLTENLCFAGGLWSWTGLVPHNAYAIKASKCAMKECIRGGVDRVFFTAWGDDGGFCSPFSVLPAVFAVSEYAKGNFDDESVKQKFSEKFGVSFDSYMTVDKPNEISTENEADIVNPSKYLLYNDTFSGMFDSAVPDGSNRKYARIAEELQSCGSFGEYDFIKQPLIALCKCLSVKAELGLNTRKAYKSGDKNNVKAVIADYDKAYDEMNDLYEKMKVYWSLLYKPHGADVLDLRFGGILARLKRNARVLKDYADGKTDKIDELEDDIYDYLGNDDFSRKPLAYNGFAKNATVNDI